VERRFLFTQKDRKILDAIGLVGRCSLKIILGVANRCSFGAPQVLVCAAEKRALPFPTTFWLVCPHLVHRAGQIESRNGVSAMSLVLAGKEEEWKIFNLHHAKLRVATLSPQRKDFLRRYAKGKFDSIRRGGVGGIASFSTGAAKCIHLQIASCLGMGCHPAREWLSKEVSEWECGYGSCVNNCLRGVNVKAAGSVVPQRRGTS
jgi:hypothetical protein